MRISVRWKWMITNLLIWSMVLLFTVTYLGARLEDYFESRFENRWRQQLELAGEYLQTQQFESLTFEEADEWADRIGEILEMRVTLIDLNGRVLGDSEVNLQQLPEVDDHRGRPEVIQALSAGFGKSRRHSATIDRDLVYLARPLGNQQAPRGIIRVAVPVSEIEDSLSQIHGLIWLASGLGFGLVMFIGFFVSKSTTQSLNEMVQAAKRIARGDFSQAIKPKENDEVGDLGLALNTMAEDLQKSVTQITQERDQLQAILNGMVEGVMVTDRAGRIVLVNDAFQSIFQMSEPILGKPTSEVFRDSQLIEALDRAITKKKTTVESIEMLSPFRKHLEAHISILGTKEEPTGSVVVFHDITQLMHLENVRRDFVANVSHEIRTPLTAIKGYTETLLENGALDKSKSKEFLQAINRHSDRMSQLVRDLLDLSKLESLESEIRLEPLDLVPIIRRVTENVRNLNSKNQFELLLDLPRTLPKVKAAATEIETLFENLIQNAIKYGGENKLVSITGIELESEVQVSIADQGIGIPIDDQPRIFERFYRVAKGRTRTMGGTGLGLAIVKHIVQRHAGRLWVESEVGKGSTFSFTLPKA